MNKLKAITIQLTEDEVKLIDKHNLIEYKGKLSYAKIAKDLIIDFLRNIYPT